MKNAQKAQTLVSTITHAMVEGDYARIYQLLLELDDIAPNKAVNALAILQGVLGDNPQAKAEIFDKFIPGGADKDSKFEISFSPFNPGKK